jgi:hypothetical protein
VVVGLGLCGVLAGAAVVLAGARVEARLGMAPGSLRAVRTQVDVSALHHGVLAWSGVYATDQPLLESWHRNPRLAAMALEEGTRSTDPCLRLSQVERFYAVGRQTSVRLCAGRAGTRLYLSQRVYWVSLRPTERRAAAPAIP